MTVEKSTVPFQNGDCLNFGSFSGDHTQAINFELFKFCNTSFFRLNVAKAKISPHFKTPFQNGGLLLFSRSFRFQTLTSTIASETHEDFLRPNVECFRDGQVMANGTLFPLIADNIPTISLTIDGRYTESRSPGWFLEFNFMGKLQELDKTLNHKLYIWSCLYLVILFITLYS